MTIDMRERVRSAVSGSKMMHGGYTDAPVLTDDQRALVDALVDTLIPPEDGWPGSVDLGVADTVAKYLVPEGDVVALYPRFRGAEFLGLLQEALGAVVDAGLDDRVAVLSRFESERPALFARVRDFVYYAYYGTHEVVVQIQTLTRFGGDYHGATQPEGYVRSLEIWGDRPTTTRGAFVPTTAVLRVPQARGAKQ